MPGKRSFSYEGPAVKKYTLWTAEDLEIVRAVGLKMTARELGQILGRTDRAIAQCRVRLRGNKPVYVRVTADDWTAAVAEEARGAQLPVGPCLSGDLRKPYVEARWRALRRLRALGVTLPNLSTVSGFHHATVLNAVRRLAGGPARKTYRKKAA